MTGFGAAEKDGFRVEIRSLNHRFMDVNIKLPMFLGEYEIPLRNMLKGKFSRGKFDVFITVKGEGRTRLKLNIELAKEICNSLNVLKSELSLSGGIGIETLLSNYKELLVTEEPEYDGSSVQTAFNEAMTQLAKMRADEGKAIAEDIINRADKLESLHRELITLIPDIIKDCKARFNERLKEVFIGIECDRDRIYQEIAFMLEKTDITEEMIRIENHLRQVRKILMNSDTIGKRLDFLFQELNREVNTVAAKSGDYRISDIIIEMKSEIEKMREQTQNIQ